MKEKHEEEKQSRSSTTNSFKDAASSKIFGSPLEELMSRTDGEVPKFIEESINHLHKTGWLSLLLAVIKYNTVHTNEHS